MGKKKHYFRLYIGDSDDDDDNILIHQGWIMVNTHSDDEPDKKDKREKQQKQQQQTLDTLSADTIVEDNSKLDQTQTPLQTLPDDSNATLEDTNEREVLNLESLDPQISNISPHCILPPTPFDTSPSTTIQPISPSLDETLLLEDQPTHESPLQNPTTLPPSPSKGCENLQTLDLEKTQAKSTTVPLPTPEETTQALLKNLSLGDDQGEESTSEPASLPSPHTSRILPTISSSHYVQTSQTVPSTPPSSVNTRKLPDLVLSAHTLQPSPSKASSAAAGESRTSQALHSKPTLEALSQITEDRLVPSSCHTPKLPSSICTSTPKKRLKQYHSYSLPHNVPDPYPQYPLVDIQTTTGSSNSNSSSGKSLKLNSTQTSVSPLVKHITTPVPYAKHRTDSIPCVDITSQAANDERWKRDFGSKEGKWISRLPGKDDQRKAGSNSHSFSFSKYSERQRSLTAPALQSSKKRKSCDDHDDKMVICLSSDEEQLLPPGQRAKNSGTKYDDEEVCISRDVSAVGGDIDIVWSSVKTNARIHLPSHSNSPNPFLSHSNCQKPFQSYSNARIHLPSHSNSPKPFPSDSNGPKPFQSYSNARIHLPSHSNSPNPFPSHSNGPKPFQSYSNVQIHLSFHSNFPEPLPSHPNSSKRHSYPTSRAEHFTVFRPASSANHGV